MDTSYRSMTAREAAELRGLVSLSTGALRVGLFLLVVVVVGWLLRGLQGLIPVSGGRPDIPLWLAPTLLLAGVLYVRAGRWTGGRELRNKIRRDLKSGKIAQHHVRVVAALEAPEIEDEGPVFFIVDETGVTLFFAGQDMARYKSRGFPWREFEISEAPESRRFFSLRPLGEPFPDVQLRAPLSFREAKALGVMSSTFGSLAQSLDELRKDA